MYIVNINRQILNKSLSWQTGMAFDNITKDFRVEGSFNRDTITKKTFITQYIEKSNYIVTDAWTAYDFLDNPN